MSAARWSLICTLAEQYGLTVVEDAAQGVNSWYEGRALGSLGHIAAYSFHETKNYICGEGGALCLNRPELVERAEIIRDKGTNRRKFFRGQVDKYTWVDVGSSYVPSEISCAFLAAQLEMLEVISTRRREIYEFYRQQLQPLEADGLLRLPHIPEQCRGNYHMFYVLLPSRRQRDALMAHLEQNGINAVFHYVPLHSSPMGQKLGWREEDLPITEQVSGCLLRLPFFHELTQPQQVSVVQAIRRFFAATASPVSAGVGVAQPCAVAESS